MASERKRRANRRRRQRKVMARITPPSLREFAEKNGGTVTRISATQVVCHVHMNVRMSYPTQDIELGYYEEKAAHHDAAEHRKTPRGVCPTCGKSEKLKANGTVGRHGNKETGSLCAGVGEKPSV